MQIICIDHIGGDHAAVEQHGKEQKQGYGVPARQVLPGQGIGEERCQRNIGDNAYRSNKNANAQRMQ